MSGDTERLHLSMDEIAAILSMGGKKALVGFPPASGEGFTRERLWSACAGLVRDGLMTQIDGTYRLRKELFEVMQPLYAAKTALILTPADGRESQMVFYPAERITAVEPAAYGGFSLWTLDAGELGPCICDHLSLRFWDEALPVPAQPPQAGEAAKSVLLLERADAETGLCTGRLRCAERGMEVWLETAAGCEPLTPETLDAGLAALLRGGSE